MLPRQIRARLLSPSVVLLSSLTFGLATGCDGDDPDSVTIEAEPTATKVEQLQQRVENKRQEASEEIEASKPDVETPEAPRPDAGDGG